MRHYFAYGSNMDRAHMAKLCPRAEALGPALLKDHRFLIAHGGYGSVARKRNSVVHGVLWRIAARDLIALDAYEEIGDGLYQHALLPVHWDNKLLKALVYVANDAAGRGRNIATSCCPPRATGRCPTTTCRRWTGRCSCHEHTARRPPDREGPGARRRLSRLCRGRSEPPGA